MGLAKVVHPRCRSLQFQEKTYWCWAATASNVAYCNAHSVSQCLVAASCLQACTNGCFDAKCNTPYYLEKALLQIGRLNIWKAGRIARSQVVTELTLNRPIGVRISWQGSSDGHFILIVGYGFKKKAPNQFFYLVFDPLESMGFQALPASAMERVGGYNVIGTWSETLLTA